MTNILSTSRKKLCLIVMNVKEINSEQLGGDCIKGYKIECPNCLKYDKFLTKSQGLTNASEHWKRCVKDQALTIYQERLQAQTQSQILTVYSPESENYIISQGTFRAITNWHRSLHM